MAPDISILIASFNRAEILRETLEALSALDKGPLAAEVVIIDNNSTDDTRATVESFAARLNVRYLFEPRSGKNIALNRALREAPLGDIVVFTDDDVVPVKNWLLEIHAACQRWPDHSVFGGPIEVRWPGGKTPPLDEIDWLCRFAFGRHDMGIQEQPYPAGSLPYGANLWLRRRVFDGGRRYDENIGPRATRRIMGSETSLLKTLVAEGFGIIYCPRAGIGHCVQEEQLRPQALRREALWYGRSSPRLGGLPRLEELQRHPALWYARRSVSLARLAVSWLAARLSPSPRRRIEGTLQAIRAMGGVLESFTMAKEIRQANAAGKVKE